MFNKRFISFCEVLDLFLEHSPRWYQEEKCNSVFINQLYWTYGQ